ncbi:dihydroorotase [Salmonella enterica subsp. salamae]|uniref:Dihydroorotase n=1 Tax=Salmonella enterica subsp. salamae TaxID=59202 RepID=A0A6D2GF60_SALER|nr:dihydroorotase [Salmonella enterica subsp. salamae]
MIYSCAVRGWLTILSVILPYKSGKIAALGEISAPAVKTLDLRGDCFVSAGWIDSHVHCYPKSPIYFDEPDSIGIATGVTTVIDAGSTGADDIDDFYALTRQATTDVYALLNISRVGLIAQNELADMNNIDAGAVNAGGKTPSGFYRRPQGADEQQRGRR